MAELVITNAGRQAAIDANNKGITVRLARIAVGTGQYVPVATQTTLQAQVAEAEIVRAVAIGTDQFQVSARFTEGAWNAYELGVFADDGTLFAVGSSNDGGDFPTKVAGTDVVSTVTVLISDVPSGSVSVVATVQTTAPKATTSDEGVVELADENDPDTDDERAVTLSLLKTKLDAVVETLGGNAPPGLDTIAKLAAALKNNPGIIDELLTAFAALTNALATKVAKAGGTMTGDLNLVTPAADDDSTKAASTEWIRSFFGPASSRKVEFTAAGEHTHTWASQAKSALVILVSGGGGPGGGGGGGGGGGERSTNLSSAGGGDGSNGSNGGDGGDTAVTHDGQTHTAPGAKGGRGGPGGGGGHTGYYDHAPSGKGFHDWDDDGGDGGAGGLGQRSGFTDDSGGSGGSGGDGQGKTPGNIRIVVLTNLALNDTITINVGDGGTAGTGGAGGTRGGSYSNSSSDSQPGVAGSDAVGTGDTGRVVLIPLY